MADTRNNYVSAGDNITIEHGSAFDNRNLGDVIRINNLIGVLVHKDPDNADKGVLAMRGVFRLAKGNLTIDPGDTVYWDVGDNNVNKTAANNHKCGVCVESSRVAAGTATVLVRFDATARV